MTPTITPSGSEQLWDQLFARRSGQGMKLGLSRMRQAWNRAKSRLDGPFPQWILVAGTNGKGTTCGLLHSLLMQAGVRSALYTSPHVVSFRERFQIGTRLATDGELLRELAILEDVLGGALWSELTFFEISTLLALQLFIRNQVEVAVLEVGLGGRLDATNVVTPVLTVITGIEKDHEAWLGSTWSQILTEKWGICRRHVPCFFAERDCASKGLQPVIERLAGSGEVPLLQPPWDTLSAAGRSFQQSIAGEWPDWLRDNLETALFILERWPAVKLDLTAAMWRPRAVSLLGRGQQIDANGTNVLLDGCANLAGMKASLAAAPAGRRAILWMPLGDKKPLELLAELQRHGSDVIGVQVVGERGIRPGLLPIPWYQDVRSAWTEARHRAGPAGVHVIGSFRGMGQFIQALGVADQFYEPVFGRGNTP